MPVEIVGHPTVRESDGCAISSRNKFSVRRRTRSRAPTRVAWALFEGTLAFRAGERDAAFPISEVRRALESATDRVDYVDLRRGTFGRLLPPSTDPR